MALGGYGRAGVGPSVFRQPGRLGPRPAARPHLPRAAPKPAAPAAAAPPSAGTPQAGTPAPAPTPSPLDSTFVGNVNQNEFQTNQSINAINQASAYGRTDLQKALSALAQQKPLAEQKTREGYNRQGLLYSGHLGQALGQQEQSFGDRQSALGQNFARAEAARQSRIASLRQSEQLYSEGQRNAAVERASRAAAADQTLGLTPDLPPTPTAPQVTAQRAQPARTAFRTVPGRGGVWHVYPGGRRVFVRR